MKWLIIAGVVSGLYGMHRLLLWMETRGWVYYIHKKASPNTLGNAVLGVQQLFQPGTEHVLEVRQDERAQQDDAGGPNVPGNKDPKDTAYGG